MRIGIIGLLMGILLSGLSVQANAGEEPSLDDYVTCAVYYRMLVGSFSGRYGSGLDMMAELNREKMNNAMELGREAAETEYGEKKAEDVFLKQWQAKLAEMTDAINRNYDNISNIKYKYKDRCETLLQTRTPSS